MTILKYNFEKFGWIIKNNTEHLQIPSLNEIKLIQFVKPSEEYVLWDEMLARAKLNNSLFTQNVAEELLTKSDLIPEGWKEYILVFPGTIWESRTGHLHCPTLVWKNSKWSLDMQWFLFDFHHKTRFINV